MKNNTIKNGIIFGFTASVTMILIGISYAAWNDVINPGDPLTATSWNNLVTKVSDLNNLATGIISSDSATPNTATHSFNFTTAQDGWLITTGQAYQGNTDSYATLVGQINGSTCANSFDSSHNGGWNVAPNITCMQMLSAGTHQITFQSGGPASASITHASYVVIGSIGN